MKFIEFTSIIYSHSAMEEYELECKKAIDEAESMNMQPLLPDMPKFYGAPIGIDPDDIAFFSASFSRDEIRRDSDDPELNQTTIMFKSGEYAVLSESYEEVKKKIEAHNMALK